MGAVTRNRMTQAADDRVQIPYARLRNKLWIAE